MMHGFEVYRMYLAMKLHFSNKNFDFFLAEGKTNAKEQTYQERNDFWFFERLAKKLSAQEVQEYLLASFVLAEDPQKVWIGSIQRDGKDLYLLWKKQIDSLTYTFKQDCDTMVQCMEDGKCTFGSLFGAELSQDHRLPGAYKLLLKEQIAFHTFLICDQAINFLPLWDKYLVDPLWERTSFKIKKYKPFLSIPVDKYREIMYNKLVPHGR